MRIFEHPRSAVAHIQVAGDGEEPRTNLRVCAQAAGVADRVRFEAQDIFTADIREATVVTMYLLPEVNLRLRPRLLAMLRPGTRIVSHAFDLGDWAPDKVLDVQGPEGRYTVFYWVVPARTDDARVH